MSFVKNKSIYLSKRSQYIRKKDLKKPTLASKQDALELYSVWIDLEREVRDYVTDLLRYVFLKGYYDR